MHKRSPMLVDGRTEWVAYDDIEYPHEWFIDAMEMLIEQGIARLGQAGAARCVLMPAAEAVETAVAWRKRTGR